MKFEILESGQLLGDVDIAVEGKESELEKVGSVAVSFTCTLNLPWMKSLEVRSSLGTFALHLEHQGGDVVTGHIQKILTDEEKRELGLE